MFALNCGQLVDAQFSLNSLAIAHQPISIDIRALTLSGVVEQIKNKPVKTIIGVWNARCTPPTDANADARTLLSQWRDIDAQLTDALNEARDNVKFLSNLDKFLEPLYRSVPQNIKDALPSLMNSMKMIHTLSRYYGTVPRMTALFQKITTEMIEACKRAIYGASSDPTFLWQRDPEQTIEVCNSAIELFHEYKKQYEETKTKLAQMPKGKQFNFDENIIFGRFDLFVRRLEKLNDMFSSTRQFEALKHAEIDGMKGLVDEFDKLISEFKKKGHALLDYENTIFERDFVEFMMKNSALESAVQVWRMYVCNGLVCSVITFLRMISVLFSCFGILLFVLPISHSHSLYPCS